MSVAMIQVNATPRTPKTDREDTSSSPVPKKRKVGANLEQIKRSWDEISELASQYGVTLSSLVGAGQVLTVGNPPPGYVDSLKLLEEVTDPARTVEGAVVFDPKPSAAGWSASQANAIQVLFCDGGALTQVQTASSMLCFSRADAPLSVASSPVWSGRVKDRDAVVAYARQSEKGAKALRPILNRSGGSSVISWSASGEQSELMDIAFSGIMALYEERIGDGSFAEAYIPV